jgi:hypothetical protein
MSEAVLQALRDTVQIDPGQRGLASDPHDNLFTACPNDFAAACRSIAGTRNPRVMIVTGFPIIQPHSVCGETDGPPGAVFLARTLIPLGADVQIAAEDYVVPALRAGLEVCGLERAVPVLEMPRSGRDPVGFRPLSHLIAVERVGPGHTSESVAAQREVMQEDLKAFEQTAPKLESGRPRSMRGRDLSEWVAPAHRLFEEAASQRITTIGIGDGGNEIGMGKIRWACIARNIAQGGLIACRVPTDHLIVAGVSNWGAYALAAGVSHLLGRVSGGLFDPDEERRILAAMVERGPLVDGRTAERLVQVDGLPFEQTAQVLARMESACRL